MPRKYNALRKRKRYLKRKMYRKRRVTTRQGLFHVKQAFNGSTVFGLTSRTITQALLDQNFGLEFRLTDIPQWGSFGAIWDQYRINKIVLKLVPMANVNQTGTSFTANPGVIATVIDYDNGGNPLGSLAEYEQYANCKVVPCVRMSPHTRVFVPRVNTGVQQSGGANVIAGNKPKQWLDCASPSIAHHGLKIFVEKYASAGSAQTWQVLGTAYISFRNVH